MSPSRTPLSMLCLALLVFSIILASCSGGTPPPAQLTETPPQPTAEEAIVETETAEETIVESEIPEQTEGYPVPTPYDYTNEGYEAPETTPFIAELPDEQEIPEPGEETGVITGQLLTPGPGGEPFYGPLFLANTINSDQEGFPPIISFSDATAPQGKQDKTGRFVFSDIPPGVYALIIWNPVGSTVIQDPEANDYLLIEVSAGEVTDLGVIGIP